MIDAPLSGTIGDDCDFSKFKLSLYAEGKLQTHLGPLPGGPKRRRWSKREHVTLQQILAVKDCVSPRDHWRGQSRI